MSQEISNFLKGRSFAEEPCGAGMAKRVGTGVGGCYSYLFHPIADGFPETG